MILSCVCALSVSAQTSDSPYEKEFEYNDGLARVLYKGKYGYIDARKKEVIDIKYKKAEDFSNGLAEVSMDGKKLGYIDTKGKVVVPLEYDAFYYGFFDGVQPAKKNGKWGLINDKGKVLVPFEYDFTGYPEDGVLKATRKGASGKSAYGFIDEKGKVIIPFEYDNLLTFNEGLSAAQKNGKYGFIDKKGRTVIPFTFDDANSFSEGLAAVKKEGSWGFINNKGTFAIPAVYDEVESFTNGEAEVLKGTKAWFIDKGGKVLPTGRWLFIFTKGLRTGEQFWYRGNNLNDEAIKKKQNEGFRFYDIAQNHDKKEYFVVMSKFYSSYQKLETNYGGDQAWDKIKEHYKDSRCITGISYGKNAWSFIVTNLGSNPGESASTNSSFPEKSIKDAWAKNRYVTNIAYGDGRWFMIARKANYSGQSYIWFLNGWNQAYVDAQRKKDYYVTSIGLDDDGTFYVVFTKGMGIKDQVFLWSEDIPMREINQYWDKGYQSYRSYYFPRHTTLDKSEYDYLEKLFN